MKAVEANITSRGTRSIPENLTIKHEFLSDVDRLRRLVRYDPKTGHIFYKPRSACDFEGSTSPEKSARHFNRAFAGRRALSTANPHGYLCGSINNVSLSAHRVAWTVYYGSPPEIIDHINGDRQDNRICNLRSVSAADNCKNFGLARDNKSGISGIRQKKPKAWGSKWEFIESEGGKIVRTKSFRCIGKAIRHRNQVLRAKGYAPMHGIRLGWEATQEKFGGEA